MVFFTFFNLYKWHQITQRTTYISGFLSLKLFDFLLHVRFPQMGEIHALRKSWRVSRVKKVPKIAQRWGIWNFDKGTRPLICTFSYWTISYYLKRILIFYINRMSRSSWPLVLAPKLSWIDRLTSIYIWWFSIMIEIDTEV